MKYKKFQAPILGSNKTEIGLEISELTEFLHPIQACDMGETLVAFQRYADTADDLSVVGALPTVNGLEILCQGHMGEPFVLTARLQDGELFIENEYHHSVYDYAEEMNLSPEQVEEIRFGKRKESLGNFWKNAEAGIYDFTDRNGNSIDDMDYGLDTKILQKIPVSKENNHYLIQLDVDIEESTKGFLKDIFFEEEAEYEDSIALYFIVPKMKMEMLAQATYEDAIRGTICLEFPKNSEFTVKEATISISPTKIEDDGNALFDYDWTELSLEALTEEVVEKLLSMAGKEKHT